MTMASPSVVLACTDGSVYASSVYDHAAWAASRLSVPVNVLHVISSRREAVPHVDLSGSIGLNARQALMEELAALDEARGRVAQARAAIILGEARAHMERAGVTGFQVEARHGSLVETIVSRQENAAVVVLGKRGEAADFEKLHLGANLERIIRTCRRPVLVAARAFKPVSRLLVAFDGGSSARQAIEYAATRPLLRGIECVLLAVGRPCGTIKEDLTQAADRLRESGYTVSVRHRKGNPEEVIATAIETERVDLLVMGAYGHSRVRQFMVGSTTTNMVRTCRVPVLMFR